MVSVFVLTFVPSLFLLVNLGCLSSLILALPDMLYVALCNLLGAFLKVFHSNIVIPLTLLHTISDAMPTLAQLKKGELLNGAGSGNIRPPFSSRPRG